jgi:hypothetical protein
MGGPPASLYTLPCRESQALLAQEAGFGEDLAAIFIPTETVNISETIDIVQIISERNQFVLFFLIFFL